MERAGLPFGHSKESWVAQCPALFAMPFSLCCALCPKGTAKRKGQPAWSRGKGTPYAPCLLCAKEKSVRSPLVVPWNQGTGTSCAHSTRSRRIIFSFHQLVPPQENRLQPNIHPLYLLFLRGLCFCHSPTRLLACIVLCPMSSGCFGSALSSMCFIFYNEA